MPQIKWPCEASLFHADWQDKLVELGIDGSRGTRRRAIVEEARIRRLDGDVVRVRRSHINFSLFLRSPYIGFLHIVAGGFFRRSLITVF